MNRAGLASATLVTLAALVAAPSTASAGYIGLGIGSVPAFSEDADLGFHASSRSAKLVAGSRFGRLSIEGALGGFDIAQNGYAFGKVYQLSLSGKLSLPLGDGFDAFGRLGVGHTWIEAEDPGFEFAEGAGNGLVFGAGIEYRVGFLVGGAIFVDYQISRTELANDVFQTEADSRMFSLGATLGF